MRAILITGSFVLWGFIEYTIHHALHHSPYLYRLHAPHHTPLHKHNKPDTLERIIVISVLLPVIGLAWIFEYKNALALSCIFEGLALRIIQFKLVHFIQHRWPKTLRLCLHHQIHHKNETSNFGITTRHWDSLFRTLAK